MLTSLGGWCDNSWSISDLGACVQFVHLCNGLILIVHCVCMMKRRGVERFPLQNPTSVYFCSSVYIFILYTNTGEKTISKFRGHCNFTAVLDNRHRSTFSSAIQSAVVTSSLRSLVITLHLCLAVCAVCTCLLIQAVFKSLQLFSWASEQILLRSNDFEI